MQALETGTNAIRVEYDERFRTSEYMSCTETGCIAFVRAARPQGGRHARVTVDASALDTPRADTVDAVFGVITVRGETATVAGSVNIVNNGWRALRVGDVVEATFDAVGAHTWREAKVTRLQHCGDAFRVGRVLSNSVRSFSSLVLLSPPRPALFCRLVAAPAPAPPPAVVPVPAAPVPALPAVVPVPAPAPAPALPFVVPPPPPGGAPLPPVGYAPPPAAAAIPPAPAPAPGGAPPPAVAVAAPVAIQQPVVVANPQPQAAAQMPANAPLGVVQPPPPGGAPKVNNPPPANAPMVVAIPQPQAAPPKAPPPGGAPKAINPPIKVVANPQPQPGGAPNANNPPAGRVRVADKAAFAAIGTATKAKQPTKGRAITAEMFAGNVARAVRLTLDHHPADDSVAMPALATQTVWANEAQNKKYPLQAAVYNNALKVLGLTVAAVQQANAPQPAVVVQRTTAAGTASGGAAAANAPTVPANAPPVPVRVQLDADGIAAVKELHATAMTPPSKNADMEQARILAHNILVEFQPDTSNTIVSIGQTRIDKLLPIVKPNGPAVTRVCVLAMEALGLDLDGAPLVSQPAVVLPQRQQPMIVVPAPLLQQPVAAPVLLQQQPAVANAAPNPQLQQSVAANAAPVLPQQPVVVVAAAPVAAPRIVLTTAGYAAFEVIKSGADASIAADMLGHWPEITKNVASGLIAQFDYHAADNTIREPTQAEIDAIVTALDTPGNHQLTSAIYQRALTVFGRDRAGKALVATAPASPTKPQTGVAAALTSVANTFLGFFGGGAAAAPAVPPEKQAAAEYLVELFMPYPQIHHEVFPNIALYSSQAVGTEKQHYIDAIAHIDDLDGFIDTVIMVSMKHARGEDELKARAAEFMDVTPPVCRQSTFVAMQHVVPEMVAKHIPVWDPSGAALGSLFTLLTDSASVISTSIESELSYASSVIPLCEYLVETGLRDALVKQHMAGKNRIEREFDYKCDASIDDAVSMLMMLSLTGLATIGSSIKQKLLTTRPEQSRQSLVKPWRLMTANPRDAYAALIQRIPAILNVKNTDAKFARDIDAAVLEVFAYIPRGVYNALRVEIPNARAAHEKTGSLRRDLRTSVGHVFDIDAVRACNFVRTHIQDAVASANRELADPTRRRFPPGVDAVLKQVPIGDVPPSFAQEILARVDGPWYQQYLDFMVDSVFNTREPGPKQLLLELAAKLRAYCTFTELEELVKTHAIEWLEDAPVITRTHVIAAVSYIDHPTYIHYNELVNTRADDADLLIETIPPGVNVPTAVAKDLIDEYVKVDPAYNASQKEITVDNLRMLWVRVFDASARAAFAKKMVAHLRAARKDEIMQKLSQPGAAPVDLVTACDNLLNRMSIVFRDHVRESISKNPQECFSELLCVAPYPVFQRYIAG